MDPVTRKVHVRVPATSANLGSGFDTVGLALDYHDELEFTLSSDPLPRLWIRHRGTRVGLPRRAGVHAELRPAQHGRASDH